MIKVTDEKLRKNNVYTESVLTPSESIMDFTIDSTTEIIEDSTNKLPENIERHIKCECDHLNAMFTITLLKYKDDEHMYLLGRRRIHIIMFQDAPTGNISVCIINGEEHKSKILYRLISVNPVPSLEKYLPRIIESMIKILATK